MAAKIVIYQDESGGVPQWRWQLRASNGEICASGEGHTTEHDAKRAAHTAADLMAEAFNGE